MKLTRYCSGCGTKLINKPYLSEDYNTKTGKKDLFDNWVCPNATNKINFFTIMFRTPHIGDPSL